MKLSRRLKLSIRHAIARRTGETGLATFEAWSHVLTHYRRRLFPSKHDPEMSHLPRFVKEGDTCLDIGANVGLYSSLLSRLVGKSGVVRAFEPVGYTFDVLSAVARRLRLNNLRLHRLALSDAVGDLEMAIPRLPDSHLLLDTPSARIHDGTNTNVRIERVPMTTLDAFLPHASDMRVSFIKCDAEGAELAIFRGGVGMFRRDSPVVLCEIAARHTERYGYRPQDLFDFFATLDYAGHVLVGAQGSAPRLRPFDGGAIPNGNYWFLPITAPSAERNPTAAR